MRRGIGFVDEMSWDVRGWGREVGSEKFEVRRVCWESLNGAGPAGWLRERGSRLPRSKAFGGWFGGC
jgi:hypothetical protein